MNRLLFFLFLFCSVLAPAQCPRLSSVMVNSCGSPEGVNEYLVVQSQDGGITNIKQLRIRYGTSTTFATSLVLNGSVTNFWVSNSTYISQLNAAINVPGCSCQAVDTALAMDVPAHKNLVILPSTVNYATYVLDNLCATSNNQIYVAFFDPTKASGTGSIAGFNNTGNFGNHQATSQLRYFDFRLIGTTVCDSLVAYDRSLLLRLNGTPGNEDGSTVTFEYNGTTTYANSGCTSPPSPLPIEWGNMQAIANKHSVVVKWESLSEKQNLGFNLWRGRHPQDLEQIAFLPSQGDSDSKQFYIFTDLSPYSGLNFYRLEQLDKEGASAFSPYLSVNLSTEQDYLSCHFNAAQKLIRIEAPKPIAGRFELLDFQGRKVWEASFLGLESHEEIRLSSLAPALYVYRFVDMSGMLYTGKLWVSD